MKATDSIRAFLFSKGCEHDAASLETQVNVAKCDGERVPGKGSSYTDGLNDWWSIRIPKNANSHPKWFDYELNWPLELYAQAIGSTGWNWRTRRSLYVGFDFDSIVGHAPGVGVEADKLNEVREAAAAIPWVEVRTSTSGRGIHLYVFFQGEGVPTDNHTEHALLAQVVLELMSAATGYDFASQLDVCGGNMWLWHRDQAPNGLKVIKPATAKLDEPEGWRERVNRKPFVVRLDGQSADRWDRLAMTHRPIPLDATHRNHLDLLASLGFPAIWDGDKHMLVTHTVGFSQLPHRGRYQTSSRGSNPGEPNCFAFPGDFGAWHIYRFGKGVAEAATWEQDGSDWTHCWFNAPA